VKVVAVIPSRYGSTRFPGKPLALIAGKPLLQRVIEGVQGSQCIEQIVVATDDERIVALARKLNVEAVMTPSELPSGTDRVEYAIRGMEADIVLNVQGDEPLISGAVLDQLIQPMLESDWEMATLAKSIEPGDLENKNAAKIVINKSGGALYFSRFGIPFSRSDNAEQELGLKHIGIYAFRRSFLESFCRHGPVPIELAEGLEQLRALYMGASIKVVQVQHTSWGVDTPEDVRMVESILKKGGQ